MYIHTLSASVELMKLTKTLSLDGTITLHRRDMLKVLTDNLPPSYMFTPHFNKRLVTYEPVQLSDGNEGVKLLFEDNTVAEADLLVGADGIKSATRSTMFEALATRHNNPELRKFVKASWSGTYGYRCLVDTARFLSRVGMDSHPTASEALFVRPFIVRNLLSFFPPL